MSSCERDSPNTASRKENTLHFVRSCFYVHMQEPHVEATDRRSVRPPISPVSPETEDKHGFPGRRYCEGCVGLHSQRLSIRVTNTGRINWRMFEPGRDILGLWETWVTLPLIKHIHPVDLDPTPTSPQLLSFSRSPIHIHLFFPMLQPLLWRQTSLISIVALFRNWVFSFLWGRPFPHQPAH